VHALIRSGAIRAINAAVNPAGRKRWRISEQALADFETARTTTPHATPARRRRQPTPAGWVEFF
jgi:hypothetical protein